MEFSSHNPVKLASHEHNENYYCSIFLKYENHFEIRVLKLNKEQTIKKELLRIEQEEDEDKKYHMIWTWKA